MPKTVKGDSLRFLNIHSFAKFEKKIEGGPFGDFEKFSKKNKKMKIFNIIVLLHINKKIEGRNLWGHLKIFENKSQKAEKGGRLPSLIVEKSENLLLKKMLKN